MKAPPTSLEVRMKSVWVLLIITLFAAGLAQTAVAVPVDTPERLLPVWSKVQEVGCAQGSGSIDHQEPTAAQHGPVTVDVDRHAPLSRWQGVVDGSPPDLTWRESFLLSRENTKYKEIAVSR